ncbi:uncharacterized protein LOC144119828 [Amblyomma americanum]
MEDDGIPAPVISGAAEAGPLVAVVADADRAEAQRLLRQGPFQQEEHEAPLEVVVTNADTGEIVKQTLQPGANAEPPSLKPSLSEAASSPAPCSDDSRASSPCQDVSPPLPPPGLVAGNKGDALSEAACPASRASSTAASGSSGAMKPSANQQRDANEAGDGVPEHVVIDASEPKGHKIGAKQRKSRRPNSHPKPTVADVLVVLCGFVITLAVLAGLAASTRHLFKQNNVLVVRLHRVNRPVVPPTLVCGVSRLSGMAELSSLCSHIIYTGDMDILSDGVEYTLLPADSANFEAFRALGTPGSLSPQLLASMPLAPLWERLPSLLSWHRLGRAMARLVNNASLHGVEVRLSPAIALNEEVLARLQAACKEMKSSDPDSIMFLRLRYGPLLASNGGMEKLVDCPDVVVFRTEHHELSSKVLRAPNPYRRYIGADMAEVFLVCKKMELLKMQL